MLKFVLSIKGRYNKRNYQNTRLSNIYKYLSNLPSLWFNTADARD